jgi:hypothetical protein
MKPKAIDLRVTITAVLGVIFFAVGLTTSLLLGLIGSFLIAGAVASHFEGKAKRSQQLLIMLAVFVVASCAAWFGLGWSEFAKRGCIPEADCQARHQFNSLEALDQSLFHLYDQSETSTYR